MKYYYDCPIKAAYMAKHFGMKTEGLNSNGESYTVVSWPNHWHIDFEGKMYIHPDSLHLLEPQEGDIATSGEYVATYSGKGDDGSWWEPNSTYPKEGFGTPWRIIQRNGLNFMWPEHE